MQHTDDNFMPDLTYFEVTIRVTVNAFISKPICTEAISFWWRFSRTRDDEQERLFESAMEPTAFLRITKECR